MLFKKSLIIISVSLISTACSKVQSVEYYEQNPDKAKSTFIECENKKAKGNMNEKQAENCSNAIKAFMSSQLNSVFK